MCTLYSMSWTVVYIMFHCMFSFMVWLLDDFHFSGYLCTGMGQGLGLDYDGIFANLSSSSVLQCFSAGRPLSKIPKP